MRIHCRACEPSHEHADIREFVNHHFAKIGLTLFGLSVLLWSPIAGALVLAAATGQWVTAIRLSASA